MQMDLAANIGHTSWGAGVPPAINRKKQNRKPQLAQLPKHAGGTPAPQLDGHFAGVFPDHFTRASCLHSTESAWMKTIS
ncbi:MAG: hypothetical protein IPL01_09605 [Acidobacteria bacterium]|nr:hypothetical protein [Acidobacteriota bacterium]